MAKIVIRAVFWHSSGRNMATFHEIVLNLQFVLYFFLK